MSKRTVLGDPDDAFAADNEEAAQGNDEHVAVPVSVRGVATVRQTGMVSGSSNTYVLASGVARLLCGEDPRRGRVTVLVTDGVVELAGASQEVGYGHAGTVSDANGALVFHHREAIYGAGVGGEATISVFTENWAV